MQCCHVTHYTLTLLTLLMSLTVATVLTCDDAVLPLYPSPNVCCKTEHTCAATFILLRVFAPAYCRMISSSFLRYSKMSKETYTYMKRSTLRRVFGAHILSHDILFVPEVFKIMSKGTSI